MNAFKNSTETLITCLNGGEVEGSRVEGGRVEYRNVWPNELPNLTLPY